MKKLIFDSEPELFEFSPCYDGRIIIYGSKIPRPHPVVGSLVLLCMVALVPLVLLPMGIFAYLLISFLSVGMLILFSCFFVEVILGRELTLFYPRSSAYEYRFSRYLDESDLKELDRIDKKWAKRLLALTKLNYRASELGLYSELEDSMDEFNDYTKELKEAIDQKRQATRSEEKAKEDKLKRKEAKSVLREIKNLKEK